jgi:[ribosomal protein S5]-alanine N-acetyltransferase
VRQPLATANLPRVAPIPYPTLGNELIVLRPWSPDDIAALLTAGTDPVVRRFRYSLPVDVEQAREWLARREAERERGNGVEMMIAEHGAPRGSISLWDVDWRHRNAMISYWLGPGARGRGLATAAVRLIAGWAFGELELARLAMFVEPDNVASRRVAERCGFVREGRLRSHGEGRAGGRVDSIVYGLLPGELAG